MENRGLLFIPDISGFSRFVNAVEIEHSRFIIQQLLEVLIRANDSGPLADLGDPKAMPFCFTNLASPWT